jgi:predicted esterase
MKKIIGALILYLVYTSTFAQIDTTFLYKTSTPYGTLDIRLAKSSTQYYYLQEGKTISYRESSPGIRTDSYLSLLSWNASEYVQGNMRERNGSNDYFIMNYRLLFPKNYDQIYSPGYPIIIALHGLGERGNCWDDNCYHADRDWNYNTNTPPAPTDPHHLLLNNELNLLNGGGAHLTARNLAGSRLPNAKDMPTRAFPGFVLYPQNMNGWSNNSVQDLIKTIRLLLKKYNIDEDRVYIHGLSNGGAGTFEVIKRAPWLFACALAMSPLSDASIVNQGLAPSIANIPLWIFQGGKDKAPSPSQTENHVKGFRDAGAEVRFYLYPDLGHGTWNTAFKEPDFFSWILSKSKSEIHTYAGNTAICHSNSDGVKMELAQGFFKYQWQKDGVTIEGATGSSYTATATGSYRARFSRVQNPAETQWNQWSAPVLITEQSALPQAKIEQIGTVLLPDLNGLNDARLKAVGDLPHYYWFKNDGLLDFDGDQDDTLNYVVIKSSKGNGSYSLVTAEYSNCPSPASEVKHIYFNNQAPVNLDAPEAFAGEAFSAGIKLSWKDASTEETGFEVWNRKLLSESTFTPWELRVITGANVSSFTDKGLEPLATYQYKIRAIGSNGRSNYTPVENNKYLEIKTAKDNSKPSAPNLLRATIIAVNTVQLTWKASIDDSGIIKRYHIYFDGNESVATDSASLSYLLNNLEVNRIYNFTVRAEDLGGNLSDVSNVASASTYISGLHYEHSTGVWSKLDDVDWSLVEFSGYIHNFSLAPKTQDDYFNFKFDGYLTITNPGNYQFSTTSSDGSRIVLDNVMVVNNDGVHESNEVMGEEQALTAGPKRITVTFFDFTGVDTLVVRYKGPDTGGEWTPIPDAVLRSGEMPTTKSMLVTAYPNPTSHNDINLVVQSLDNVPLYINMIDDLGRLVYEKEINADELWQGIKITPPENLVSGLYLITIRQNKSSGQCKVVVRD